MRFAPSGRALGLGFDAALQVARARGYAEDIVSVLLQEAEAEIIPIINSAVNNGTDHDTDIRDPLER